MGGKKDVLGEARLCAQDKGKALAAHSTLNRMELGALGGDWRYRKIIPDAGRIEALLMEEGVKAIPRRSREIVLDFDATDDPLHGAQLRDVKWDASDGTVEALKKIVTVIRRRFGNKVRKIVRADSGFSREAIMAWCEGNGVFYCLGLARNERLSARLGKAFGKLTRL
ncbi:MAG: transposase [Methylacidiphilales bacterium]|nr:transposase [Candidatus Methylacidiphilales bacterium]